MEVCFQKSLLLFVADGYCVFENNICVDLLDVLGREIDCANSPLLGFSAKARCPLVLAPSIIAAVKVANSLLSGFFTRARYPLVLAPSGAIVVEVYG